MKNYGVIKNSSRSVWAIKPNYMGIDALDDKAIIATVTKQGAERRRKHLPLVDNMPVMDKPDDAKQSEKSMTARWIDTLLRGTTKQLSLKKSSIKYRRNALAGAMSRLVRMA